MEGEAGTMDSDLLKRRELPVWLYLEMLVEIFNSDDHFYPDQF